MKPATIRAAHDRAVLDGVYRDYFWSHIEWDTLYTAADIGAHIGSWSWVARQYAPHLQIVALEPHPDNVGRLHDTLAPLHPPVAIRHAWCGYDSDAQGLMAYPEANWSASHYIPHDGIAHAPGAIAQPLPPRWTLEDICAIHGGLDLLKLDCEGSEFDILLHCDSATLRSLRVVVGEYHGAFGALYDRLTPWFHLTVNPLERRGHFLAVRR